MCIGLPLTASLRGRAGKAVDLDTDAERNCLMYESAEPLARLYSPLFLMEDTFILQEYFVPKAGFAEWLSAARPAFDMAAQLDQIELLNTTVRFVHKASTSGIEPETQDLRSPMSQSSRSQRDTSGIEPETRTYFPLLRAPR